MRGALTRTLFSSGFREGDAVPAETTMVLETITPKIAAEYLTRNTSNRNRRPTRIQQYARDMGSGNWPVTGESIKFSETGDLLDGQHRLVACVLSGVSFQTWVAHNVPAVAS